ELVHEATASEQTLQTFGRGERAVEARRGATLCIGLREQQLNASLRGELFQRGAERLRADVKGLCARLRRRLCSDQRRNEASRAAHTQQNRSRQSTAPGSAIQVRKNHYRSFNAAVANQFVEPSRTKWRRRPAALSPKLHEETR